MSQSQEGQLPKAECYPCCCLAVSALATTTLRLANHCTSTREQFSLQNWNETTQKDQLKRLYVSGSNLKQPSSEWRQNRNWDTRKAPRHYSIAFMQFVSNMEA